MRRANLLCMASCILLFVFSCTVGPDLKDGTVIKTNEDIQGRKISIRFTRGPEFSTVKRFGFVKAIITPQIAVWIEDTLGRLLQTIYVTHKFAKQDWGMAKHGADTCFRTSSLPHWLNKYVQAGNFAPTKNKPLPDGITAATPPGSFDIQTTVGDLPLLFVVKAEINSSFDYNAHFNSKRDSSKINGQPAVVFSARVNGYTYVNPVAKMSVKGRSGETGADPALYNDTANLTTAQRIFDCVNVLLNPAEFQIADSLIRTGATKTWTWDLGYRKKKTDSTAKK
jgi:hypothetical protein